MTGRERKVDRRTKLFLQARSDLKIFFCLFNYVLSLHIINFFLKKLYIHFKLSLVICVHTLTEAKDDLSFNESSLIFLTIIFNKTNQL